MAIINFNCVEWEQQHPDEEFSLIPENTEMVGVIEFMEEKQTLSGGKGFKVTYKLQNNRKIFDFINFECPSNQQAENIGRKFLKDIGKALNHPVIKDTNDILNKPLILVIGVQKGGTQYRKPDGTIGIRADKNNVKRVKPYTNLNASASPAPMPPTPQQPMTAQPMTPAPMPMQNNGWGNNAFQQSPTPPWQTTPPQQPMTAQSLSAEFVPPLEDDLPF